MGEGLIIKGRGVTDFSLTILRSLICPELNNQIKSFCIFLTNKNKVFGAACQILV